MGQLAVSCGRKSGLVRRDWSTPAKTEKVFARSCEYRKRVTSDAEPLIHSAGCLTLPVLTQLVD